MACRESAAEAVSGVEASPRDSRAPSRSWIQRPSDGRRRRAGLRTRSAENSALLRLEASMRCRRPLHLRCHWESFALCRLGSRRIDSSSVIFRSGCVRCRPRTTNMSAYVWQNSLQLARLSAYQVRRIPKLGDRMERLLLCECISWNSMSGLCLSGVASKCVYK